MRRRPRRRGVAVRRRAKPGHRQPRGAARLMWRHGADHRHSSVRWHLPCPDARWHQPPRERACRICRQPRMRSGRPGRTCPGLVRVPSGTRTRHVDPAHIQPGRHQPVLPQLPSRHPHPPRKQRSRHGAVGDRRAAVSGIKRSRPVKHQAGQHNAVPGGARQCLTPLDPSARARQSCDNFLYGFKGAPSARQADRPRPRLARMRGTGTESVNELGSDATGR
jgi:hypothetical protein